MTESEEGVNRRFAEAIEAGEARVVESMLESQPELANASDWTPPPLHCAVKWRQVRIVEILVDHGAHIESLDPDRQTTPLRYGIMYCCIEVLPTLLARGANTGAIVEGGTTALQLAAQAAGGAYAEYDDLPHPEQYAAVVRLLREMGAE